MVPANLGKPVSRFDRMERVAWLAIALVVCFVGVRSFICLHSHSVYPIYAQAGRDWAQGNSLYGWHPDLPDFYRYTPSTAVLLVPFGLLPDSWGNLVWRLVLCGVYFLGVAWWFRALSPVGQALTPGQRGLLWLLLLPLSAVCLNNGQVNALTIGLVLAALAATAEKRWNVAAWCAALAAVPKFYPLAVGLLLTVAYPRRFGARFALALAVAFGLPFLCQHPHYALGQYADWFHSLVNDRRHDAPFDGSPLDLLLLLRLGGFAVSAHAFWIVRFALAGGAAGLCWATRQAGYPVRTVLTHVLAQSCCWMILCGPATEVCTYILLAPAFVWTAVDAWRLRSFRTRLAATGILGLALLGQVIRAVPEGRWISIPLLPGTALLLWVYWTTIQIRAILATRQAKAGWQFRSVGSRLPSAVPAGNLVFSRLSWPSSELDEQALQHEFQEASPSGKSDRQPDREDSKDIGS